MAKPTKTPPVQKLEEQIAETPSTNVLLIEFGEDTKHLIRELTQALANKTAPVINLQTIDSNILNALINHLGNPQPSRLEPLKEPVSNAVAPKQTAMKAEQPQPTETVTLTQIRELINSKVASGKKPAVIALLQAFEATSAQLLAEEHYPEFYKKLMAL